MDSLRVARVDNVVLEHFLAPTTPDGRPTRQRQTGALHLTSHHLIFSQTASSSTNPSEPEIWIPYPAITLLTRLPQSLQGLYPLQIETRTFDSYVLLFEKDREGGAEDVWQSVKDCAVKTSVEQLHAFFYSSSSAGTGWSSFNPRNEFSRQGVGSRTKAWRFTDINKDYSFCRTYPSKLVVPSRISDSTLSYAAKYRSKGRIPALSYLHWANNASITRSSQPMVGLKNSRSAQDERLVECIFTTHIFPDIAYASTSGPPASENPHVFGATTTNLIIDARPTTNAMANVAMGAGTENMENYKSGKKAYLGIDNIHVMRNSLKTIAEAFRDADSRPSGLLDRSLLRKSNWLRHISTILDGALMIVRNVHLSASHVLIHCSDGWDRTAQLSAIAQLALDPYYRTIDGFKVLIEKDWLAFGHKFLDRSGHLSSEKLFMVTENDDESDEDTTKGAQRAAQAFFATVQKQFTSSGHLKEISPVFHQFLDCVWQLQRQYPSRFEFNEQYLLEIYRHLYSCQYGTFLFNCERERQTPQSAKPPYVQRTVSIWDEIDSPTLRAKYLNSSYEPALDERTDRSPNADQGVLLFDSKDVKFWYRLFRRGDEEMNGSPLLLSQAQGAEVLGPLGAAQDDPVVPPLPPREPSPRSSPAPNAVRKAAAGTGWKWSQLSSGALSAVQSAARDIKSISQDALAQLKAEANEVDGEMWTGARPTGESPADPFPKLSFERRIPSETNPWSVEASSAALSKASAPDSTNPWTKPSTALPPSLDGLRLSDGPKQQASKDAEVRAALGEDQKAWDPLGAL